MRREGLGSSNNSRGENHGTAAPHHSRALRKRGRFSLRTEKNCFDLKAVGSKLEEVNKAL